MIGLYPTVADGTGMKLTGNNGGVWFWATDFINWGTGWWNTQDSGTSNREIFLTQVVFDGCYFGLRLSDQSYTNVVGIWASACDGANIFCEFATDDGILNVSGGTVFNAGANARGGAQNGVELGSKGWVDFSNAMFRANIGAGLRVMRPVRGGLP
ncbi:hypothetical protein [Aurantimonas coralicida]|uniref:hypothetical protein n=1 Tax=Aurantimonas coralicida TaxID=182270 RepID=UPI001D194EB9|nr:hypothetical protein [Aurantimonas coralicida]MCC4300240.1 hypothetical protein [Aurantimonas coralicida]